MTRLSYSSYHERNIIHVVMPLLRTFSQCFNDEEHVQYIEIFGKVSNNTFVEQVGSKDAYLTKMKTPLPGIHKRAR